MLMPDEPEDGFLSRKDEKPRATGREPLPSRTLVLACKYKPETLQFAGYKQNSGRGEGLIYNIPAIYFQIRWVGKRG